MRISKITLEGKYLISAAAAVFVSFFFGAVLYLQILYNRELYFVSRFTFGLDFREFYNASRLILAGENPYKIERFITPPFSSLIAIPFLIIKFSAASRIFSIMALILFLLSGAFLIKKQNFSKEGKLITLTAFGIITALSYPAMFLFDRANIDFIVVSLIIFGICVAGTRQILSGFLIGLAILLKIYPIIILVPLLIRKKYKIIYSAILTVFLFSLSTPNLLSHYFKNIFFNRLTLFRYDENTSLINLVLWIKKLLSAAGIGVFTEANDIYFIILSYLMYAAAISLLFMVNMKKPLRGDTQYFIFFPFMAAVPALVYQYELIAVIPIVIFLPGLLDNTEKTVQRIFVWGILSGIVLCQLQVIALGNLTSTIYPHFFSSLGLFILLLCIIFYSISMRNTPNKNKNPF